MLNKLAPTTGINANTKLINKFFVVDHYNESLSIIDLIGNIFKEAHNITPISNKVLSIIISISLLSFKG